MVNPAILDISMSCDNVSNATVKSMAKSMGLKPC